MKRRRGKKPVKDHVCPFWYLQEEIQCYSSIDMKRVLSLPHP